MNNKRWKVTLIVDIEEWSHPRKFIPEAVSMGLHENEDLVDYKFEEVSNDFKFPSSINN